MTHEERIVGNFFQAAANLNTFVQASAVLLLSIVLLKLFASKEERIPVFGTEFPLKKAWVILVVYTAGHLYFQQKMIGCTKDVLEINNDSLHTVVWLDMTKGPSGGLVFEDFEPRDLDSDYCFLGIRAAEMKRLDIASIISICLAFFMLLAMIDLSRTDWKSWIIQTYHGLIFVTLNWAIGSGWAMEVSRLAP